MSRAFDFDRFGNFVPMGGEEGADHLRLATLHGIPIEELPAQNEIETEVTRRENVDQAQIIIERSRDSLLTDFGKATLDNRYLLPGESYQDLFARVAAAYADDLEHAQRLYDYISKLWFMPATPVLTNGGADRGLPISCFLNQVDDSLAGIMENYEENMWLAANGGGIGSYWGGVRSMGEKISRSGETSGIIPFIRVSDSFTLAISQGSLRRGSAAMYLDIHHPEIEEFLEIRKPSGDFNRKALNLHHGVVVTDAFMEAVEKDEPFDLISPRDQKVMRTISARSLWQKILEIRLQTGEPYIIFKDAVNRALPKHHKELGFEVKMSNLCTEIFLPNGEDHLGNTRTAVCCLSSVNLEKWDEWATEPQFIEDVMRFLDNVLQDFIDRSPASMKNAKYSAMRERSVGLGVMGFHSFLMKKNIPFESAMAKSWNMKMFKHIRKAADQASYLLALEKGACPDAAERNVQARFSHKMAVAPTASISIICGGTSAGIEPVPATIYTHKTLSGSYTVKNPYLEDLLEEKDENTTETWQSILEHQGSIQHLTFLTEDQKAVFKTAFELDQRWVIEMSADRTPFICQGQSVNLFLPPDINKWDLMMLHRQAWKLGLKSLYYARSQSIQRAQFAGSKEKGEAEQEMKIEQTNYEECLACQ